MSKLINAGDKVNGTYCGGFNFSGTVLSRRCITVKTDGAFEFDVQLDQPITVYGQERNRMIVVAKLDGSPSSYTKFTDSMGVAA